MKICLSQSLLGIALTFAPLAVRAQVTVVDWGGEIYLTSSPQNASWVIDPASGSSTAFTATNAYSASDSLGFGSGYTGPTISGGVFGSVTGLNTAVSAPITRPLVLRNDGSVTTVRHQNFGSVDGGTTSEVFSINAAVLFSTGGEYLVDETSSLSYTGRALSTPTGWSPSRWLVVSGGTTYVSESTFTITSTASPGATFTLSDPDAINWAAWTPGADLSLGSLTYNIAGSTFTGVTQVGYYLTGSRTNATLPTIDTYGFTAALTAVPEPSSYALALCGLCVAVAVGRRRRARLGGA